MEEKGSESGRKGTVFMPNEISFFFVDWIKFTDT